MLNLLRVAVGESHLSANFPYMKMDSYDGEGYKQGLNCIAVLN